MNLNLYLKLVILAIDWFVVIRVFKRQKRNELAIVRLDAIGDFILWLDSAKEYRRLYPNQRITLVANSVWADLASRLPYWDKVLSIELDRFTRNPLYRWKTLFDIRNANFGTIIHPVFSRMLLYGDSIVRASHANQRIGSVGDLSCIHASEKNISDRWYTCLVSARRGMFMELDRNAEFVKNAFGIDFYSSLPKLPVLDELSKQLQIPGDYFIVFPGASKTHKQWPVTSFVDMLDRLSLQCSWQPVLCGSSKEVELCASIVKMSKATIFDFSGKTTLPELVELIRRAMFLVSNDTSAIHIANAVDTPSICILGGGHYGRFLPYSEHVSGMKPLVVENKMPCFNCNWQCTQSRDSVEAFPCVASIEVESVLDAIIRLLVKHV